MNSQEVTLAVTTATSTPRAKWCPDCKAYTAVAFDVFALVPTGLTYLATYALCEICDDPSDQEARRD